MSTTTTKTIKAASKTKQIKRIKTCYTKVEDDFKQANIKFCLWSNIENTSLQELSEFAKVFKKVLKVCKQRDELYTNGYVPNNIVLDTNDKKVEEIPQLRTILSDKYPSGLVKTKEFKFKNGSREKFKKQLVTDHPEIFNHLITPEAMSTVENFRNSIDIADYDRKSIHYNKDEQVTIGKLSLQDKEQDEINEAERQATRKQERIERRKITEPVKKIKSTKPVKKIKPTKIKNKRVVDEGIEFSSDSEDDNEINISSIITIGLANVFTTDQDKPDKIITKEYKTFFKYEYKKIISESIFEDGNDKAVDELTQDYYQIVRSSRCSKIISGKSTREQICEFNKWATRNPVTCKKLIKQIINIEIRKYVKEK